MSRFTILVAALAGTLGCVRTAGAEPMLTGAVTYDSSTQLYTYSYVIDDRSAQNPVDAVFIRVATHVYDLTHLNPVGFTAPAPFSDFHLASAADVHGDEAVFASGTVYGWEAGSAAPGDGVYGFSFTSRYGPGTGEDSNYEVFDTSLYDAAHQYETRLEVGRVVAPELAYAPEPRALGVAAIGFVGLALRRRHRIWSSDPHPNPFEAQYKLKDLGREAAEFGVFELSWEQFKARR